MIVKIYHSRDSNHNSKCDFSLTLKVKKVFERKILC